MKGKKAVQEVQAVTGDAPEPESPDQVKHPLRSGHADIITRLITLIEYQESITASLRNELRQFLLVGYGVDMTTQRVIFDKESGELRC